MGATSESRPPPRTSDHRDCSSRREAGAGDIVPALFLLPNEIRDPRRQTAHRSQPGPCARRTAVESRDASSRDHRIRGVGAKSEGGAEAEGLALAPNLPGSCVT